MSNIVTFLDPIFRTDEKFIKVGRVGKIDILIFGEFIENTIEICFSIDKSFPKSHDGSAIKKDMEIETISNIVKYEYPTLLKNKNKEVSELIFNAINK